MSARFEEHHRYEITISAEELREMIEGRFDVKLPYVHHLHFNLQGDHAEVHPEQIRYKLICVWTTEQGRWMEPKP